MPVRVAVSPFRFFVILLCYLVTSLPFVTLLSAQQIRPLPSAKIYGELIKLKSLTSVLYVAAHPDDENTRLLSWLATGRHIRTAYMSITRGDGGQNILGSEQGAALGLIRTYELLEARKLDGAEQFFGRAVDFGFSKTSEETFKQWDRVELIADVVRAIRYFKPDLVICRFPKDSNAGHGQHSASAIIAEDAVKYCNGTLELPSADLARIEESASRNGFKELYGDWKPHSLMFNALRFGSRNTIVAGMFKLDVGQYDPALGMGYGELAGISRSLHKSQGAGTPSTPGVQPEFFATLIGEPPTKSLFDGIDTTWSRVGRPDIATDIDVVLTAFDTQHPERSVDALLKIRHKVKEVKDKHWREQKLSEIDKVIVSCIGLTADATVNVPTVAEYATDSLQVTVRLTMRAGKPVKVLLQNLYELITAHVADDVVLSGLGASSTPPVEVTCEHDSLKVISNKFVNHSNVSEPYWLKGRYSWKLSALFKAGDIFPATDRRDNLCYLTAMVLNGDTIETRLQIRYKKLDPLRGDVFEELRTVPPVSIEPITQVVAGSTMPIIKVRLRAFEEVKNGRLKVMDGNNVLASIDDVSLHAQTDTMISIKTPVTKNATLLVHFDVKGSTYQDQVRTINYEHIPTLQYLEPAEVKVITELVAFNAKRIAFIAGAGEFAPEMLRSLGISVDEISDETILKTSELLKYDAVLVGIRAINTNKNMKYLMPALMSYVEQGGTLVMQYNTLQTMSTKDLGPYPLPLANKRVTEEDAQVRIIKPANSIMTKPNVITEKDFEGWVQERGLYFPFEYDSRYESILSMNDTNEAPLTGSLLYAKYGKGHYVYCALSLFRQLPAGVPGAMKLFANMLSLGR